MSLDKYSLIVRLKSAAGLPKAYADSVILREKAAPFCSLSFRSETQTSKWIDKDKYDESPEWSETFTWQLEDAPTAEENVEVTVLHKNRKLPGPPPDLARAEVSLACVLKQQSLASPVISKELDVSLFSPQKQFLGTDSRLQVEVSYSPPLSKLNSEISEMRQQMEALEGTVKALEATAAEREGELSEAKARIGQLEDEIEEIKNRTQPGRCQRLCPCCSLL